MNHTNFNGVESIINKGEKSWKCIECGAVMAPWQKVCVNCQGNSCKTKLIEKEIIETVQNAINDRSLYVPDSFGAMNAGGSTK